MPNIPFGNGESSEPDQSSADPIFVPPPVIRPTTPDMRSFPPTTSYNPASTIRTPRATRPPTQRSESPAVPVTADMLPDITTGPMPMQRPHGYKMPTPKTDVEVFGAYDRPAGWGVGGPSISPVEPSPNPDIAARSPRISPVSPGHYGPSPRVSPVPIQDPPSFSFGGGGNTAGNATNQFSFGGLGGANAYTTPTPKRMPMARPLGAPSAFELDFPSASKTPKTPVVTMTPRARLQRPIGAPSAEPDDVIIPPSPPATSTYPPVTPKLQRPVGAPSGNDPPFGELPDEPPVASPAPPVKQPLRRPGMPSFDSAPIIDRYHAIATPGPAYRGLANMSANAAPPPIMPWTTGPVPTFGAPNAVPQPPPVSGWATGHMRPVGLPGRNAMTPGPNTAALPGGDPWGRTPAFGRNKKPELSPVIPVVPELKFTPPSRTVTPQPSRTPTHSAPPPQKQPIPSPARKPANVTATPGPSFGIIPNIGVVPPSPAKSMKPTLEEVEDEGSPPSSPWDAAFGGVDIW